MLLFRQIFDFEQAKVAQEEQRCNERYTPGAAFPLQATLIQVIPTQRARVRNVSDTGLGLLTGRETDLPAGEAVRVRLTLDQFRLDLDGRVVHREERGNGIEYGVGLNFGDFIAQKAWLQLLQPIIIGQSLRPVAPERIIQNEPQFIKQVFRGESDSVLTVWLEMTFGTPLHGFEFQMHDYFCRAEVKIGVLEAYLRESTESHKGKLSNPVFDTSGGLHEEIRQLFRWVVPNLSQAIPDDVRAFLGRFAR